LDLLYAAKSMSAMEHHFRERFIKTDRKATQVRRDMGAIKDQPAVLMADDDAEDCWLANEAFAESGKKVAFICVQDGLELMDYLAKQIAEDGSRGLPDLILLDLNMPRKDGREALIEIKADASLRHIPIVVLTTSEAEKDIAFTMKAGAESFITKPATFDDWVKTMKTLLVQWL
jgi:CheY-like chemotaxis protein